MPEQNGMERSRWLELRRMQIQRMQYGVAVEQSKLHVEELRDKIAEQEERVKQTEKQIVELDEKIAAAQAAAEVAGG